MSSWDKFTSKDMRNNLISMLSGDVKKIEEMIKASNNKPIPIASISWGGEGAGLPMPKIESAEGGVRVTFQRNNVNIKQSDTNVTSGVTSDVTSLSVAQLTERQRKICEMIKKTLMFL